MLSTAKAEYVALGEDVKETLSTGAVLPFMCPKLNGSCAWVRIIRGHSVG